MEEDDGCHGLNHSTRAVCMPPRKRRPTRLAPVQFKPSDRFYRFIVRTGLTARWLLRIPVTLSGLENLPPTQVKRGYREVIPGQGRSWR